MFLAHHIWETLRKLYSRWSAHEISDPRSHANEGYMNTPEKKAKLDKRKKRAQAAENEVLRLQQQVEQLTRSMGRALTLICTTTCWV